MAFDEKSLAKLNQLYPDVKNRAIRFEQDVLKVLGVQIRITEGLRSFKRQAELYLIGRDPVTFKKIGATVTNARAGESVHHYGCAFDICFAGADPYLSKFPPTHFNYYWRKTGEIAQRNGFKWGYDWNGNGLVDGNDFDRPHFEITYGERVNDLREFYSHDGLVSVWARLDQRRGVAIETGWDALTVKSLQSSLD